MASTPPFPSLMPSVAGVGLGSSSAHGHSHGAHDDHHGHSHGAGGDHGHAHSHGGGSGGSGGGGGGGGGHGDEHHGHSHSGGGSGAHGHAHDDDDHHGHSHGGADHHGHSHGGGDDHGHSHGSHDDDDHHGHSHGGGDDHGHSHSHGGGGDDHGHSHSHAGSGGSGSSSSSITGAGTGSGVSDFGPRRTDRRSWSVWWAEQSRVIHADRDAKRLFYFIALNAAYMGLQLFYGLVVFNIGLITGSFHTGFDCLALASSLAAMVVARRQPEFAHSYGYDRFEVLAGFTNALFLLFVAVFLIFESAHMFYKPFETRGDGAFAMAVCGLVVDAVGFALFHKQRRVLSGGGSVGAGSGAAMRLDLSSFGADRGGRESNLAGVFLHIVADVLHHIAHVCAVTLALWKGWTLAHGALSLLIAVLIIRAVYPLFQYTGLILLQTTPHVSQAVIESRCRQIGYYDGVLEVKDAHFWTHSPGVTVGSVHIRVRADVHESAVLQYAHAQLKPYVHHLTVQIVKDNWMIADALH